MAVKGNKVVWNEVDETWECLECGARYNKDELARMFDYTNEVSKSNFVPIFCMDCGAYLREYEK